jgi:opacity protein-like surface antigen
MKRFVLGAAAALVMVGGAAAADADAEGFVPLFNGQDLAGWEGAVNGYKVEDGVLYSDPKTGGNLITAKEYGDFILRFEFLVGTNANNGLGIRFPGGDAAYNGMELQILDDSGPAYTALQPYQYHGSIYGVVPARRGFQKKVGQWNFQEVRAIGSRITVILNGEVIVDADLAGITETMDHKAHPGLHNPKGRIGWLGHGTRVDWRNIRIKEVPADYQAGARPEDNTPPPGFTALFNGRDLSGWKGVTRAEKFDNPLVRQQATPEKRAAMQAKADDEVRAGWAVRDGGALYFNGKGYSLATAKDYGDFELSVDWRLLAVRGDSGLYLRGSPQVQIWDAHNQWHIGSGGLYNNKANPSKPLALADRLIGDWNTFRIKMVGDKVTVTLNGTLVVDSTVLENYWDRNLPIFPREQLELQCHGDPIEFKNIYIREL